MFQRNHANKTSKLLWPKEICMAVMLSPKVRLQAMANQAACTYVYVCVYIYIYIYHSVSSFFELTAALSDTSIMIGWLSQPKNIPSGVIMAMGAGKSQNGAFWLRKSIHEKNVATFDPTNAANQSRHKRDRKAPKDPAYRLNIHSRNACRRGESSVGQRNRRECQ